MKKLILLLLISIIIGLPCFAEYKPIPKELSKQYRTEMEQVIKQEYPEYYSRIKNYDKVVKAETPEYRYTTINIGLNGVVENDVRTLFTVNLEIFTE